MAEQASLSTNLRLKNQTPCFYSTLQHPKKKPHQNTAV